MVHQDEDAVIKDEDGLEEDLRNLTLSIKPEELLDRCKILLDEITQFTNHLQERRRLDKVEYRHFRNDVRTDTKALEKLAQRSASGESELVNHAVKSSNLPFLEAVWAAAKGEKDIVALKRHGHIVDVSAEGGLKWVKVSTITESRLLAEMAEKGWEWIGMSDDEGSDYGSAEAGDTSLPDGEDVDLSLMNIARTLTTAAKATRVNYRYPSVHIVLTRVCEGRLKDIDLVLDNIRELGVTLECRTLMPGPHLDAALLDRMVPNPWDTFTPTINIDCTLLLAFVSDISHQEVGEESWFNSAVRRQIEAEVKDQLLPATLWPATVGRRLVCTVQAAKRMREIVATIGTEGEKARTEVLLASPSEQRDALLTQFAKLSRHSVPADWQLPIEVLPSEDLGGGDTTNEIAGLLLRPLPSIATAVEAKLSEINRSVFCFGWSAGITTITSNRTVARQVESLIEQHRSNEQERGPDVWVCATSRSLVAKEKDRRESERY